MVGKRVVGLRAGGQRAVGQGAVGQQAVGQGAVGQRAVEQCRNTSSKSFFRLQFVHHGLVDRTWITDFHTNQQFFQRRIMKRTCTFYPRYDFSFFHHFSLLQGFWVIYLFDHYLFNQYLNRDIAFNIASLKRALQKQNLTIQSYT